MIYILTGAIRSGKTTALQKWIANRKDVDGLLCPDDDKGKRYFLQVKSKIEYELETEFENKDIIEIGNFRFLKSAFDEANDYLISKTSKKESKYIIIDELGKLELRNEGFHVSAEKLIPDYECNQQKHLILVIRESLIEPVLKKYSISEYTILTKEDLNSFC
ncbi:nucleoside-triphosphatase [Xanthomarina sp. F2636L]|uniref:nucleoside-triphosphatase n=1 Tax=Xanthomarina sp. F2636L TaxID=2996018 RepID=UPI00225E2B86|nr:nucleoside-triphosphatase [Xanthomarina sp. F2636L]MCX7549627.1 hypothetical protein [Xanthomarina sp. F2636L]